MYIYRIKIKNFRNIRDLDWKPNKNFNILFGANGSGKSNIACALNLLFNGNFSEDVFDYSDFYNCDTTKKIEIECWLDEVKTFNDVISGSIQHIDKDDNIVEDDTNEDLKTVLILNLCSEGMQKKWSVIQSIMVSPLTSTLRQKFRFDYLKFDRLPEKDINLTKSGLFYKNTKSNETLWEKLNEVGKNAVEQTNKNISTNSDLSSELTKIFKENKNIFFEGISIGLKDIASSYFSSGFQFITDYKNYSIPLTKHSKGKQNLFLFDLILNSLDENSMVFIEELEQNLEPINQKKVALQFRNKIKGQLFLTSHSASLLEYFDMEDMFYVKEGNIIRIINPDNEDEIKFHNQVLKFNKHEFIATLMSSGILLCEGPSESYNIPTYSEINDNFLLQNNIEILKVEGKGNFYCFLKMYNKVRLPANVLLDNDDDNKETIKYCTGLAQNIFIQQNDYEDIIYPYLCDCCEKLGELISFTEIKDFLQTFPESKNAKRDKYKEIKNQIEQLDFESLSGYKELYRNKILFTFVLHEKFISSYYSRFIANLLKETGKNPQQYKNLFDYLSGKIDLKSKDGNPNVKYLGEIC